MLAKTRVMNMDVILIQVFWAFIYSDLRRDNPSYLHLLLHLHQYLVQSFRSQAVKNQSVSRTIGSGWNHRVLVVDQAQMCWSLKQLGGVNGDGFIKLQ